VKLALISPLRAPLAVSQGQVFYPYLTVGLGSLVTQAEFWYLVLKELAVVSRMSRFFPPNSRILRPWDRPSLGPLWLTSPCIHC